MRERSSAASPGVIVAADRKVGLRPVSGEDRELLMSIYGSTREEELRRVPWPDSQKLYFIEMQFTAQDQHWREAYPEASWDVIVVDGSDAGRLYVNRGTGDIRIIDIALLPPFRNLGIGSKLLDAILDEGRATGRTVSIHVERMNPAIHLYERLGFSLREDKGVYLLMERKPGEER